MADAARLLIKNGTLIDGSGGEPVPNKLLVVEGNRITLVGDTDGSMRPETPDDRSSMRRAVHPARSDRRALPYLASPGRIAGRQLHVDG